MMQYLLAILIMIFSVSVWAEDNKMVLTSVPANPGDMASIKRGAKLVATNCLACHPFIYLRYDKVAQEAGITYDKMPINIKNWPYGVTPPDLSLEADVRGVDWLYTYLHSFYQDSSRPTGVNNLLVPNTAMPAILAPYQGEQVAVKGVPATTLFHRVQWYDLVKLTHQGSMTPEKFDETVTDIVNFLDYAAEPYRKQQEHIGWWVLGFLCVLFILMYLLKREYWKDVKKYKKE
jgi:ubiquinol-cytochrome c reductase cytochrome c1 subunit